MKQQLQKLKTEALDELAKAATIEDLDSLVLKYFGRQQGKLNAILKALKNLTENERKEFGSLANQVKVEIWKQIDDKRTLLKNAGKKEFIDFTGSVYHPEYGHHHPVTLIRREIELYFAQRGFAIMLGPEIESDYYNFESLNIPAEHPARDMWDTFYVKSDSVKNGEKLVLRTHISPMQVRVMEKFEPPFAVVSSGRVFRHEATDARHEHTYDYTEGFVVGEKISLANLKDTLMGLFKALFGPEVEVKMRPSYFPFTEPSVELLMGCIFCDKKGCSVCHTGWLEMLGAGMIHPKVLEYAGYPKNKFTGYAFGIGISRVAMLKYNIQDIRQLYENDQKMLNQF